MEATLLGGQEGGWVKDNGGPWAIASLCGFDLLTTTSAWSAGSTFLGHEVIEGREWGPWREAQTCSSSQKGKEQDMAQQFPNLSLPGRGQVPSCFSWWARAGSPELVPQQ